MTENNKEKPVFKSKIAEREEEIFRLMGHLIIEVLDTEGVKLLMEAKAALNHQYHVAILTERRFKDREG